MSKKEKVYSNRFVTARSTRANQRVIDDLVVLDTYENSVVAMHDYTHIHGQRPDRELYVLHTSREELKVEERRWFGIRDSALRRLPKKNIPECAGFSFVFKARQPAHSKLCNGWHNAEDGRKDKQAGMFFDRNRLIFRGAYPMKVNVDIDMSPEELRKLLGLPDVEPLQREMMEKLRTRMLEGIDGYDPVKLLQPYLTGTLASWDFLQKIISVAGKSGKSTEVRDAKK